VLSLASLLHAGHSPTEIFFREEFHLRAQPRFPPSTPPPPFPPPGVCCDQPFPFCLQRITPINFPFFLGGSPTPVDQPSQPKIYHFFFFTRTGPLKAAFHLPVAEDDGCPFAFPLISAVFLVGTFMGPNPFSLPFIPQWAF